MAAALQGPEEEELAAALQGLEIAVQGEDAVNVQIHVPGLVLAGVLTDYLDEVPLAARHDRNILLACLYGGMGWTVFEVNDRVGGEANTHRPLTHRRHTEFICGGLRQHLAKAHGDIADIEADGLEAFAVPLALEAAVNALLLHLNMA